MGFFSFFTNHYLQRVSLKQPFPKIIGTGISGYTYIVSIDYDSYRYGVMAPFKSICGTGAIKRMVLEL
jgi:hypothetical protein